MLRMSGYLSNKRGPSLLSTKIPKLSEMGARLGATSSGESFDFGEASSSKSCKIPQDTYPNRKVFEKIISELPNGTTQQKRYLKQALLKFASGSQ